MNGFSLGSHHVVTVFPVPLPARYPKLFLHKQIAAEIFGQGRPYSSNFPECLTASFRLSTGPAPGSQPHSICGDAWRRGELAAASLLLGSAQFSETDPRSCHHTPLRASAWVIAFSPVRIHSPQMRKLSRRPAILTKRKSQQHNSDQRK